MGAQVVIPGFEWSQILPELLLAGAAVAVLMAGTFQRHRGDGRPARTGLVGGLSGYALFTVAAAGAALVAAWSLWSDVGGPGGQPRLAMAGSVIVDGFGIFFTIVICITVGLGALLADGYLRREQLERPELFVLLLLSGSGGILMAKANDLILVFLGLEILSIALYVMAGYHARRARSLEAAIKYFVLGAFSSALFLYGMALVYGATGSTNLLQIAAFLRAETLTAGVFLGGVALLIVGLGFKVAAVPFHMWTPDVYEGAPTPVTGFMAGAAKAAGFAALLRIVYATFITARLDWQPVIWALAALSLVVGSVLAVVQTNVKRMLAYSSIAHAGYILVGLQAGSDAGIAGALFYILAYTFMVTGTFAVATVVGGRGDRHHTLDDYRGLAQQRPVLAFAFTVLLLAQAGVPLTSGFFAKFYVIAAAVASTSYALAIVAMLAAVIAAFLYLRIIVAMYMTAPEPEVAAADLAGEGPSLAAPGGEGAVAVAERARLAIPTGVGVVLGMALAFTLVAGFFPSPVVDFARDAILVRL